MKALPWRNTLLLITARYLPRDMKHRSTGAARGSSEHRGGVRLRLRTVLRACRATHSTDARADDVGASLAVSHTGMDAAADASYVGLAAKLSHAFEAYAERPCLAERPY